ncbi:MAG: hypothetical protein Tsb0020_41550 [Haliangiales bacterium]
MHDIVDLEDRGLPSVFVATVEFIKAAEVQSSALGIAQRGIFIPHPIQDRSDDEMTALADAAIESLLGALTGQPSAPE